jgi:hypothetical protein
LYRSNIKRRTLPELPAVNISLIWQNVRVLVSDSILCHLPTVAGLAGSLSLVRGIINFSVIIFASAFYVLAYTCVMVDTDQRDIKMGDVNQTNESMESEIEREDRTTTTTTDATEVTRTETVTKPDELQYEEPGSIYLNDLPPAADRLFGDNLSLYAGNVSNGQTYGQIPPTAAPEAQQTSRWKRSIVYRAWTQGKGMLMVVLSQFFGSSMNVMTQLLERDGSHGKAMHPFQVSSPN